MTDTIRKMSGNDTSPLVTVAMPVYNAGKYLRLAVLSIVEQTFGDWELLIVDDGSTDNALQSIADIRDERIRILRDGDNKGLAARLNECIDLARGRYLARMDQDDVSYPERFARQIAALQGAAAPDLVATRAITIDENDQATGMFPFAISHQEICARPWRGFHFPHPAWMGRIEWFRKHRYTVPGPYFCEDQELLLRSYRDSRFETINEVLFAYRVRGIVNERKLSKTRLTILKIQLRNFANHNEWGHMLLSGVAYFGRLHKDLSRKLRELPSPGKRSVIDRPEALKWQKTLNRLQSKEK